MDELGRHAVVSVLFADRDPTASVVPEPARARRRAGQRAVNSRISSARELIPIFLNTFRKW